MATSERAAVPDEVRDRLLKAWRGEIEAGAVYELIARRLDERRADILRRMAEAEGGHRRRLEARMTELGVPIPDPAEVTLSRWMRLQARLAPVERLLAAREAAEDDEVGDLYLRPTGDPDTDRLLREIRKEERSHSLAVKEMRGDGGDRPDPSPVAVPGARERLDRILGRERWHQTGGGWISGAIYGANEHTGKPTQAALAAGLSTGVGAIIPVVPFIFTTGTGAIAAAAIVSLVAHFLVGAAKSLVTLRTWWAAGLEMTLAGVIVGGATYTVGLAFPT